MTKCIIVGELECAGYSNTVNNSTANCYGNDYYIADPVDINGQVSDDIFYQFTLERSEDVTISTCASSIDTYVHLLASDGTLIASNDDNGPLCATTKGSIVQKLGIGTYYVVVEGKGAASGSITLDLGIRSGLYFDGSNDNVELDNSSLLNLGTGDFTFEAYVYSSKTSGYSSILDKRNITYDGFVFGIASTGKIWMQMNGTNIAAPSGTPNLYDSKCHHLAVTRNSADSLKYYVDGDLVYTTYSAASISSTAGAARMGWDKFYPQYFNGYIRDVRVWNVARTQSQIEANMNVVMVPTTGLVGCWRMLESTGQTVSDLSGNAITGTLGTTTSVQTTDPTWTCQAACADGGPRTTEYVEDETLLLDSIDIDGLELKVYPNPFTYVTNVSIFGITDKVKVEVIDISGKIIYVSENYVPNSILTLGDNYQPGIYLLKASNDRFAKILKLVKIK
jgi:hypothetical protein